MGQYELTWDDEYLDGNHRAAALQTAFDVAARVAGAAVCGGQPNEADPDSAAGPDPLAELAGLTEVLRWLSGVRDELLFLTREAYELADRDGPGSWQELADAMKLTRTPVRQQYELLQALHRRGGGLLTDLLAWDAKHRPPPTAEQVRRRGRGKPPDNKESE